MRKSATAVILLLGLSVVCGPLLAREPLCRWKWRQVPAKKEVSGTWQIEANSACLTRQVVHLKNSSWLFHSLEIMEQPENGVLEIVDEAGIRFAPDQDFTGEDKATVRVTLKHLTKRTLHPTIVRTRISVTE